MADLREKWEGMSAAERLDFTLELQRLQSGSDKKVSELQEQYKSDTAGRDKKIDELTRKVEKLEQQSGEAIGTLEGLQKEAAAVLAQKQLNERVATMLERGVEGGIEAKLAVEFATMNDPEGSFDRMVAEIDRRASEKVDEILAQSDIPESSPSKPIMLDLSQFSQAEISRLPKEVVERYMESEVMK